MDLTGYVEHLRSSLADAAAAGGEVMVDAAERLATALDAAMRMALLEALADATAEITASLDGPSVEVRLKGRDPDFVVTPAPATGAPTEPTFGAPAGSPLTGPQPDLAAADDDTTMSRITLRIPEGLKQRAEAAAAAGRQSLNTWLVDAVRVAADVQPPSGRGPRRAGKQLSGWVR